MLDVKVYTDGAARGNPDGPGGYGTVLQFVDSNGQLHEKELSAGYKKTTNNRMELMAAAAAKSGASLKCVVDIIDSLTTEEAYKILINEGIDKATMVYIMNKIDFYLNKRAGDNLNVQCIVSLI